MNTTECAICKAPADTWQDKTEKVQVIDCTGGCGKYKIDGCTEVILRVASLSREQITKLQEAVLSIPDTIVNSDFIAGVLRAEVHHE
jgi:acyl-CoA synthetase (NDP forming)